MIQWFTQEKGTLRPTPRNECSILASTEFDLAQYARVRAEPVFSRRPRASPLRQRSARGAQIVVLGRVFAPLSDAARVRRVQGLGPETLTARDAVRGDEALGTPASFLAGADAFPSEWACVVCAPKRSCGRQSADQRRAGGLLHREGQPGPAIGALQDETGAVEAPSLRARKRFEISGLLIHQLRRAGHPRAAEGCGPRDRSIGMHVGGAEVAVDRRSTTRPSASSFSVIVEPGTSATTWPSRSIPVNCHCAPIGPGASARTPSKHDVINQHEATINTIHLNTLTLPPPHLPVR